MQWAGKAERTSFEVPTVSLHVHERIDPRTIIKTVRKKNGDANGQGNLFDEERDIPLKQEIEFYQHAKDWSNRLITGDSLLVMNSLLQKENMASKVQCAYIDPPYGIKYGSNFQPFMNKRNVQDGKDEDLTREPEMIKAFRDTWELGLHSYLSYMRDRLFLTRELLTKSGSVFVQISDENVHHIREVMDEVFGAKNFIALIPFRTKNMPLGAKYLEQMCDFLLWYAKDKQQLKYRQLFIEKDVQGNNAWKYMELPDGTYRRLTREEINNHSLIEQYSRDSIFRTAPLEPVGMNPSRDYKITFEGKKYSYRHGWKYDKQTMNNLIKKNRLIAEGNILMGKYFLKDYSTQALTIPWIDTNLGDIKTYVVQTALKIIERCILMTADPGDLVLDITCGSGTTAYVAEKWGRRWITCDTSRIATSLARQRLMTATFDYYQLAHPDEGVGSGFEYKTVPHATFKSIADDEPPATETLYDQPKKDSKRARVTGPFTVEAVPAPTVQSIDAIPADDRTQMVNDAAVARYGATLHHSEWCDELLKAGIRGKDGHRITFSRVEPLPCRYLSADAETKRENDTKDLQVKENGAAYKPQRVVISFGPEYAPLGRNQVKRAIDEAQTIVPPPKIIVFAAFQFDSEATKDIDETNYPGVALLKVEMNTDLQMKDLLKKQTSNESFRLIGQPDIRIKPTQDNQWQVEVLGFDYFDMETNQITSGGTQKIACWMLDTDYDGRSLYPRQVFFTMGDAKGGWGKLARNLKAEIDEELINAYHGNISLPFETGENRRIAVKIVDNRGIESLKVLPLEE